MIKIIKNKHKRIIHQFMILAGLICSAILVILDYDSTQMLMAQWSKLVMFEFLLQTYYTKYIR